MQPALIAIEKKLINEKKWHTERVFIYALDRATIGIAPQPVKSWEYGQYLYRTDVPCVITYNMIAFEMPRMLCDFYMLGQPHTKFVLSGQRSIVLMTVTTKCNCKPCIHNMPALRD